LETKKLSRKDQADFSTSNPHQVPDEIQHRRNQLEPYFVEVLSRAWERGGPDIVVPTARFLYSRSVSRWTAPRVNVLLWKAAEAAGDRPEMVPYPPDHCFQSDRYDTLTKAGLTAFTTRDEQALLIHALLMIDECWSHADAVRIRVIEELENIRVDKRKNCDWSKARDSAIAVRRGLQQWGRFHSCTRCEAVFYEQTVPAEQKTYYYCDDSMFAMFLGYFTFLGANSRRLRRIMDDIVGAVREEARSKKLGDTGDMVVFSGCTVCGEADNDLEAKELAHWHWTRRWRYIVPIPRLFELEA
jgi:hypothetical protein